METFGSVLKSFRQERGYTLVRLAQRMGVSQEYLVRIEKNPAQAVTEQIETILAFVEKRL